MVKINLHKLRNMACTWHVPSYIKVTLNYNLPQHWRYSICTTAAACDGECNQGKVLDLMSQK